MGCIVRSRRAKVDALQIWVRIAENSFDAADKLIDLFNEKLEFIADFPGAGPARPELGNDLRSYPVGNYLIIYRALKTRTGRRKRKGIEVVRIVYGARDLRRLFPRR